MNLKTCILLLFSLSFTQLQAQIVTTIYPLQIILTEIVPNSVHVHCLVPPAASPHTHELLPSDLRESAESKILIYGGKGLDKWAEEIPDIRKISILPFVPESLRLYPDNFRRTAFDPHFWTDPLVVKAILPALTETLSVLFPVERDSIIRRTEIFSKKLDILHLKLKDLLRSVAGTAILSSHPFFHYFLWRYGFVISGTIEEIPGKEPTAKMLQRLINMVNEKNIRAILTHPQLSDRPAQMISESTGIALVELDPLGGTGGRTQYIDLIMFNARRLHEGLP